MTIKKTLASALASIALLLPSTNQTQACTGSRQGAMGDTGVSTCDNANTVYWNQGKLSFLEQPQLSFLKKFGNNDGFRYDTVINFAMPLNKNTGAGIQYIDSQTSIENQYGTRSEDWQWLKLGLGGKVYDKNDWKIGVGGAITTKKMNEVTQYKPEWDNGKKIEKNVNAMDFEASCIMEKANAFTKDDTFRLQESDKRLQWVQKLRDEAHRSAINFHKKTIF